jgi:hypothetical protein
MKTSIQLFLVLSALCMTLPANAQHRIGMAGGLNLARFDTELTPGEKLSNYTGIGLGGILDLRLANNIALRLQPMYLQKGAKLESDELPEVEVKFKLSYVELPVLLKLALGKGASQPYLLAGPAIGFLSSAKIAVKASGSAPKFPTVEK